MIVERLGKKILCILPACIDVPPDIDGQRSSNLEVNSSGIIMTKVDSGGVVMGVSQAIRITKAVFRTIGYHNKRGC